LPRSQLVEEWPEEPKPPREVESGEPEERLDDDDRVEEADPELLPQDEPEPDAPCVKTGP
jgi:hypothetical protein